MASILGVRAVVDRTPAPGIRIALCCMPSTHHEGRHPRRRPRHPLPARHQGDAEGDAARRRQAGDPVRRRGGRRGRHRRHPDDHRPQQERAREPLRPRRRARGARSRRRATTTKLEKVDDSSDLADIHFVRQGDPKGLGHAVLRARASTSATSRSRCCSATTSSTSATRCSRRMIDEHERTRRDGHRAAWRSTPTQIHLYGAAAVEATDDPDVVRVTGLVEKPEAEDAPVEPRDHRPLRADARDLRRPRAHRSPARAARSSSPTRCRSSPPDADGPAACTASCSAVAATTPAIGSTTSRPSCSSPRDRDDLGPELRPWLKEFAATL